MSDGKIRISWDEMNSPEVDRKVKQQEMLGRAEEHQQQMGTSSVPEGASGFQSLLRNAFVYMSLFGLAGGILAWFLGEMAMVVFPDRRPGYLEFHYHLSEIGLQLERGEITDDEAQRLVGELEVEYGDNPFVAIHCDASLDESERCAFTGIAYPMSGIAP